MATKKTRDSNFELLRIISMIMIVMTHIGHSGAEELASGFSVNLAILRFFQVGAQIAVSCFILTSGYFLANSKFKASRLISLLVEIFLYSTVIYLIFVSAGRVQFDLKAAVWAFFPVSTNAYWFMTGYVIVYILSPFINILLKNLNQKSHLALMLILLLVGGVLPFIADFHALSNVAWFVLLYITGAYVAKYPKLFEKKYVFLAIFAVLYIVGAVLMVAKGIGIFKLTYPTTYICAISLFVLFKHIKLKYNPVINLISSATLGVYLIHDNGYVRSFIWNDLFKVREIFVTNDFWWKAVLIVVIIYITCTVIDILRQKFFWLIDKFVKYNIFDEKRGRFLS